MHVKVYITYKEGVLDPQGRAIEQSLHTLGYREVQDVRMGKVLEMRLDVPSRNQAEVRIREMCEKLLANPVIEDYRFEIEDEKLSAVSDQQPTKGGPKADG
jgi:phosphoribosylformylglycinamidine synthase